MKNLLTVLILSLLSLNSCAQKQMPAQSTQHDMMQKEIQGNWQWVSSTYCRGSQVTTPKTCKCSKKLVIGGGILATFEDELRTDTASYNVEEIHFMKDPVHYILASRIVNYAFRIQKDTLFLDGCREDRTNEVYVKIKK